MDLQSFPTSRVIEARVDWLTGFESSERKASSLIPLGQELVRQQEELGNRVRPFRMRGFEGECAGEARWGTSDLGNLLVVSGGLADRWKESIATLADHLSRVDYAATVQQDPLAPDPGEAIYESWAQEGGTGNSRVGIRREITKGRGNTTYLGSRRSAYFSRIYDKHAESGGVYPPGSWRWEVEIKSDAARYEGERLRRGDLSREGIVDLVSNHFRRYGIPVSWGSGAELETWHGAHSPTDVDRTLLWFDRQVRKRAQWLATRIGRQRTLDVLGLTLERSI